MITLELARRLRDAGVEWTPRNGDQFAIPDRDLDGAVFTVSDMVVEVLDAPTGTMFTFNGTTEWALDAIEQDEVIWLPREDQLRHLLRGSFVSLTARSGGYVVEVHGPAYHVDTDAACALARAVLASL